MSSEKPAFSRLVGRRKMPPSPDDGGFQPSEDPTSEEIEAALASDSEADVAQSVEHLPKDPAGIGARQLVSQILAAHSGLLEACHEGAVVVIVAPPEWCKLLENEWCSAVYANNDYKVHAEVYADAPDSVVRARTKKAGSEVASALWQARPIVGIAGDLDWLPPSLVRAADHVIEVRGLDVVSLQIVAERVSTGRVPMPCPSIAADVTPNILRTAVRKNQTAEEYLGRVAALVAAERKAAPPPKWTLDNLPMPADVEAFGRQLASDLQAYRAGTLPWSEVDRGALLVGPPGCGKTTFAQALAATCGVPLIASGYSQWESDGAGGRGSTDVIARMRKVFADARKAAPCILFVDEVDSFIARGTAAHNEGWWRPIVNALLAEIDGVGGREGVVLIAATNDASRVDDALRRSGRLDRGVHLTLPDEATLARILAAHLPLDASELATAARLIVGSSGADCERLARLARRRARSAGRAVSVEDVIQEAGGARPPRSPASRRRTATHEAGHALVSTLRRPGSVGSISIREDGRNFGGTAIRRLDGDGTEPEIQGIVVELLAGRAAETLVFGTVSGGSGGSEDSDLARATMLSVALEASFGLGENLTWRGEPTTGTIGMMLSTDRVLAARVEARLVAALDGAKNLLRRHLPALDALASALLDRESLTGPEVLAIVEQFADTRQDTEIKGGSTTLGGI